MKADIFLLSKYVAICGEVNSIPETTPSITQKTKLWRGIKGTRGFQAKNTFPSTVKGMFLGEIFQSEI